MKFIEVVLMLLGVLVVFGIGTVSGYMLQVAVKFKRSKTKVKVTKFTAELSKASQKAFDTKVEDYTKGIRQRINQSIEQGIFWAQVYGGDNHEAFQAAVKTFEKQGLGVDFESPGCANLYWGKTQPAVRELAEGDGLDRDVALLHN